MLSNLTLLISKGFRLNKIQSKLHNRISKIERKNIIVYSVVAKKMKWDIE